uniref:Uncharacterized protein n=1 Tax=Lepeophtheirus salmonis TaxID=72036 RepID=A0A0K2VCX9_LEPSM
MKKAKEEEFLDQLKKLRDHFYDVITFSLRTHFVHKRCVQKYTRHENIFTGSAI